MTKKSSPETPKRYKASAKHSPDSLSEERYWIEVRPPVEFEDEASKKIIARHVLQLAHKSESGYQISTDVSEITFTHRNASGDASIAQAEISCVGFHNRPMPTPDTVCFILEDAMEHALNGEPTQHSGGGSEM